MRLAGVAGWVLGVSCLLLASFLLWSRAVPLPQDRLLPAPLPEERLWVVVLGTSLVARYDWPDQLEASLRTCMQRPVEVETVARSGASIAWGARQAERVLDLDPDLVLIEFAINDADLRDGVGRDRARELTSALLAELLTAPDAPQVALMTMSPAHGLRGLLRPGLARRYADYMDLSKAKNVGLVDLYPRWLARPRAERGLQGDGLHPDADMAAEVIVPTLSAYIGRAAGQSC